MFFKRWQEKFKEHKESVQKAREAYLDWFQISNSPGWKIYEAKIVKKIDDIKDQMTNNHTLAGEDLKKLQLALQVWKEVQRIPKILEENAKKGMEK